MLFLLLCCSDGRSFEQISFLARPRFLFIKITLIQPNLSVRKVYVLIVFIPIFSPIRCVLPGYFTYFCTLFDKHGKVTFLPNFSCILFVFRIDLGYFSSDTVDLF